MRHTGEERNIICGGLASPGLKSKKGIIYLNLGDRNQNVNLKIRDITRKMALNVPSVFIDLLEIAAYVYCADQALSRGGAGALDLGAKWRRSIIFSIPVRHPDIWSSKEVGDVLQDTLSFLSEDQYRFTFTSLKSPLDVDLYFEFPAGPGSEFQVDEVLLFSGGLDSFAGAVEEIIVNKHNVALVSHRSSPKIAGSQVALVKELSERSPKGIKPFHVPVWINKDRSLSREFTQRTRSFLYACLGATVATMFKLHRIRFYENGVVSLNLPVSAQVIGARATRMTHPKTLSGFAKLFSLLTGKEFQVNNPFVWKTKGEVTNVIGRAGCADLIKETISCSRVYERTKVHTHCGVCSQCVDRRFGTLASAYGKDDPAERYKVNIFTDELEQGTTRTMVESYVRTAEEINEMSDNEFFAHFGETSRAVRYLDESSDRSASNIFDLHQRHAEEVLRVVDTLSAQHTKQIRKGTLPDSCLLILNLPEKYKTLQVDTLKKPTFIKEGEYWTICFEKKIIRLKDAKGLNYILVLLRQPKREVKAIELLPFFNDETAFSHAVPGEQVSDAEAIDQYKSRLAELKVELEEANANNDLSRKDTIQEEIENLEEEIRRSTGLDSRIRRFPGPAERARQAVSAAIHRTMANIQKEHPSLGQHLRNSLKIGSSLSYSPDIPISWET